MNSLIFALLLAPAEAPQPRVSAVGRASVRIISAEVVRFGENFQLDSPANAGKVTKPPMARHKSIRKKVGQPETRLTEFY